MPFHWLLLLLCALACAAEATPPTADDYGARIRALEAEIRALLDEQARLAGPEAAAANADYAAAKARAERDVRLRLEIVEYHLAAGDYPRAVAGCNAILRDHPHEPATLRLKYRILQQMLERERAALERERAYRAEEALADAQRRGLVPQAPPSVPRTVWVFDEDVQEAERQAVRARLQAKVSLSYDGVKVGELLKPLFAIAGINYVILDEALPEQTLTLHLVDDTVENALSTIAKLVNIRYNYSANTVFIGAADDAVLVSEIIRLSSGLTDVVSEPQLPSPVGSTPAGGGTVPSAPADNKAAAAAAAASGGAGGQGQSDLERFLEKVPELVVGWPSEGRLYLERKSNTLYVRATPWAISELKRLLRALDYHNAQILIEARFIEISEDAARRIGIDWGGAALGERYSITGPHGSVFGPVGLTPGPGSPSPATISGVTASSGGNLVGGLLAQVLYSPEGRDRPGIFASLQMLESEGKAQSLAEPRILTVNNAVGVIQLLQSVSFIENYEFQTITTGNTRDQSGYLVTSQTAVPRPVWKTVQEGFTLRIRPSVARNDDTITLDIRPTVTQRSGNYNTTRIAYQPSPGADSEQLVVSQPEFITRTLATTLHIKNGQTVVLGGLTTEVVNERDGGVPGLRRVPGLGRLFSHASKGMDRRNLLIFVTAHLIDPTGARIGEDIRRLRDAVTVVLPEEVREAEAERRAEEAERARAASERAEQPRPRLPQGGRTGVRR
ncbi:MAG: hypothetical protein RMM29_02605 [Planctomycetota bacterium]|nr:hypothetical protein [Planctomycetota bacterium]MCX8040180.1 hypothetical protein [Planctomycetota bacterium]MDW8372525.1 hypothetical protein [Planctomycetota bacterium]